MLLEPTLRVGNRPGATTLQRASTASIGANTARTFVVKTVILMNRKLSPAAATSANVRTAGLITSDVQSVLGEGVGVVAIGGLARCRCVGAKRSSMTWVKSCDVRLVLDSKRQMARAAVKTPGNAKTR